MKKIFFKCSIEYPVTSIVIVLSMIFGLYYLVTSTYFDKYVETMGIVQRNETGLVVYPTIEDGYFEAICNKKKVIWYRDRESAIYEGTLIFDRINSKIIVEIQEQDFEYENLNISDGIYLKLSYDTETVLQHLLSKYNNEYKEESLIK